MRIKNTGQTGALKLRLSIDKDFYRFGDAAQSNNNLKTMNAFTDEIDCLAPGSELLFALGQGWVIFGADANPSITPQKFVITATYQFNEKEIEEKNYIDLRPFLNTEPEHDPLVEEIEKIREILEGKK